MNRAVEYNRKVLPVHTATSFREFTASIQFSQPQKRQGKFPVKVTTENGPIEKGDLLVTASVPGKAMKYDSTKDLGEKAIGVVGVALESLSTGEGKIMSLVKAGWVNNQQQTILGLKNDLVYLAAQSGIDLENKIDQEKVSVTEDENHQLISTITEDLNLQGNYLLNVGGLKGLNNKWQIDKDGSFITIVSTDEGDKSFYAIQSENS
jgi:hypothetical protein